MILKDMQQSSKVYLFLSFLIILLIGIIATFSAIMVTRQITQVGTQHVQYQLEWVQHTLEKELKKLQKTAESLGRWTTSFPSSAGTEYLSSLAISHELNLIGLFSTQQTVVQKFDLQSMQAALLPKNLQESLHDYFLSLPAISAKSQRGLSALSIIPPALIATVPLNHGQDAPQLLIIGRYLSTVIAQMTEWTEKNWALYAVNDSQLPPDVQTIYPTLLKNQPFFVEPLNEQTFAGYLLLTDFEAKPAFILRITSLNIAQQHSRLSLRYLWGSLWLVGLLLGAVVLWLAKRLERLERISTEQLEQELHHRQRTELALQKAHEELQQLSVFDDLTKIANRRRFDDYLQHEWRRLCRENQPLSLVMCDIDYFNHYQDTFGQEATKECLQKIAKATLQATRRPADLAARYSGEWIGVILPNTDAKGAFRVALNIRMEVRQMAIIHPQSPVSEYVTLSMGVSSITPTQESSPETLIDAADKALEEAKKQGRNRVVLKSFQQT